MKLINCINLDNFPTSVGTFPLLPQDDISGACPQLRCMMFLVVGFGCRFWKNRISGAVERGLSGASGELVRVVFCVP